MEHAHIVGTVLSMIEQKSGNIAAVDAHEYLVINFLLAWQCFQPADPAFILPDASAEVC